MPAEDASRQPHEGNYKQKYKLLKRKLKFLVYEQECFMEELRRTQRKVLKVARDRSFLLDRLGQYERGEDTTDESDGTTSGSELDAIGAKKKSRVLPPSANQVQGLPPSQESLLQNEASQSSEPSRKKAKMASKKSVPIPGSKPRVTTRPEPTLSREEVERQLDSKPDQPYMQIDRAPLNMPSDIFNNDSSNADSELNEASHNLVMDMDKEDLSVD